jgi:thiol:disulfide interchange protein DsbC
MLLKLKNMYPRTTFSQVKATPVPGITEVVMGNNVAYVDESGRYFMFGHLYDMQTQSDLTQVHIDEVQKIDISHLDTNLAFKIVKGDGSRVLYLFSDPECPFCQRLEHVGLDKLTNVSIYVFMMPLESIHQHSRAWATSIWCAKDRAAAWHKTVFDDKPLPPASCDNPIDKVEKMALAMGINGTPTMFAVDGSKQVGALPTEELDAWLTKHSTPKK